MRKSAKTSSQGGFPYGQTVGGTSARPRLDDRNLTVNHTRGRALAERATPAASPPPARVERRAGVPHDVVVARRPRNACGTHPLFAARRPRRHRGAPETPRPHWLLTSISSAIGLEFAGCRVLIGCCILSHLRLV